MTTFIINTKERRKAAAHAVANLRSEPVMEVEIRPYRNTRTVKQNRAYWGVWLREIEEFTGVNAKAWHEFFKKEFAPTGIYKLFEGTPDEKVVEVAESTTDMTTKEFSEYCEHIRRYCAEKMNLQLSDIENEH